MPAAFPGMNDLRFLVECNHWVMSGQLLAKQAIHLQVDHHIFINQLALLEFLGAGIDGPGLGCGNASTAIAEQLYGWFLKDVIKIVKLPAGDKAAAFVGELCVAMLFVLLSSGCEGVCDGLFAHIAMQQIIAQQADGKDHVSYQKAYSSFSDLMTTQFWSFFCMRIRYCTFFYLDYNSFFFYFRRDLLRQNCYCFLNSFYLAYSSFQTFSSSFQMNTSQYSSMNLRYSSSVGVFQCYIYYILSRRAWLSISIFLMLSFVLQISMATSLESSTVDSVSSAAYCRLNSRFRKASSAYIDYRSLKRSFLSCIITFSSSQFSRIRASKTECELGTTSCYSSALFSCAILLRFSFFSSKAAYFNLLACKC